VRYSQILVENRRFNLPHLYLAPSLGVTPLEFRQDLWHQKPRRIALSCGIKNVVGRFFGLVTKHACDRQTDRRTDGQNYDSQDRASIAASRGKNELRPFFLITIVAKPHRGPEKPTVRNASQVCVLICCKLQVFLNETDTGVVTF